MKIAMKVRNEIMHPDTVTTHRFTDGAKGVRCYSYRGKITVRIRENVISFSHPNPSMTHTNNTIQGLAALLRKDVEFHAYFNDLVRLHSL